ncbi:hypothetical protein AKO1_008520 [Acrasis kona]|uniref:Helicase ATP-binding domain-containing protein n=1 Tax=Acrasis kona TaxID=1008807 RepID=A0AAW2YLE6_9EUKA
MDEGSGSHESPASDVMIKAKEGFVFFERDLMDQCGGRNLFFVDGHQLVDTLITEGFVDMTCGGQFLHLSYLIEKFVMKLLDIGAKCQFIFFSDVLDSCIVFKQMAFEVAKAHLTFIGCTVKQFRSGYDELFENHILCTRPSFYWGYPDSDLSLFFYHVHNVIYVVNLRFEGNTLYGLASETKMVLDEIESEQIALQLKNEYHHEDAIKSDHDIFDHRLFQRIKVDLKSEVNFDLSSYSCVLYVCHQMCQKKPDYSFHCRLLLVTLLLQNHLPLQQRAFSIVPPNQKLLEFLGEFMHTIIYLVKDKNYTTNNLYDIVDSRLFHMVYYTYCNKFSDQDIMKNVHLPDCLKQSFRCMYKWIPDHVICKVDRVTDNFILQPTLEIEHYKLLPVENKLIQEMLSNWPNTVQIHSVEEAKEYFANSKLSTKVYKGINFHWHSKRPLLSKYETSRLDRTQKRLHAFASSFQSLHHRKLIIGANTKKHKVENMIELEEKSNNNVLEDINKVDVIVIIKHLDQYESNEDEQSLQIIQQYIKGKKISNFRSTSLLQQYDQVRELLDQSKIIESKSSAIVLFKKVRIEVLKIRLLMVQYMSNKKRPMNCYNLLEKAQKDEKSLNTVKKHIKEIDQILEILSLQNKIENVMVDCLLKNLKRPVETSHATAAWIVFKECVILRDLVNALDVKQKIYTSRIFERINEVMDITCKLLRDHGFNKSAFIFWNTFNQVPEDAQDKYDYQDLQLFHSEFPSVHYLLSLFDESKSQLGLFSLVEEIDVPKVFKSIQEKIKFLDDNMYDLGFKPDDWQIKLIEMVRRRNSVLVAAPTSSGKTFIAFYVIERILRESSDGVVVFVLPNNALANQVYAEVYSKYNKNYNPDGLAHMLGMFTADDQINMLSCQVLITNPACLEILMLSPNSTKWKNRMRYVIFDEVHTIREKGSGQTIENCIKMITCPFIALSATIANPQHFVNWVQSLKKESFVDFIQHFERPRPLEYEISAGKELLPIHPCAVLDISSLTEPGFQILENMSPYQSRQLFQIGRHYGAFSELSIFLNSTPVSLATRSDFNLLRQKLKNAMTELYRSKNLGALKNIIKAFQRPLDNAKFVIDDDIIQRHEHLLCNMIQRRLFPCIMFHFNKMGIDMLTSVTMIILKANKWMVLWPDEATKAKALSEIKKSVSELRETNMVEELHLKALLCGVAVHYNSMYDGYRKEVEKLFRLKYIPLIISTSTLALGIHMPAKSVVMYGTSKYMDNIMFQQCAGRSGRRGFDVKGVVIFQDFPRAEMEKYVTADVTNINGSALSSPSFFLRILMLGWFGIHDDSERVIKDNDIVRRVTSDCIRALGPSFLCFDNHPSDENNYMIHHFRFCLEFLMRQGYIDVLGRPLEFAGVASNLFYHEPGTFLFIKFLREGLFDDMVPLVIPEDETYKKKDFKKKKEGKNCNIPGVEVWQIDVVTVFSYLFAAYPVFNSNRSAKKKPRVLPSLPNQFKASLKEYKKQVNEIYTGYVRSCSASFDNKHETTLPLSKIRFKSTYLPPTPKPIPTIAAKCKKDNSASNKIEYAWNSDSDSEDEKDNDPVIENSDHNPTIVCQGPFLDAILQKNLDYNCVSSFAALSGNDDTFEEDLQKSLKKLLGTVRGTVPLFESSIPFPTGGFKQDIDSFLVDYLKHGSLKRLVLENNIPNKTQARTMIEDAIKTLKKICTSFSYIENSKQNHVMKAFESIKLRLIYLYYGLKKRPEFRKQLNYGNEPKHDPHTTNKKKLAY